MKQSGSPSCGVTDEKEENWKRRLRDIISRSGERYRCVYDKKAVVDHIFKAFDAAKPHRELYFEVLHRALGRVKADKGVWVDHIKKSRIWLPIGRVKKGMVIFYTKQPKNHYLISYFQIHNL